MYTRSNHRRYPQVTSSKTLYGGDMMTTTSIMKKLALRMSQNVQTFSDPKQREAIVTDMLLGVIKTGKIFFCDNGIEFPGII